ncbi:peptidase family M49-domain-containing protein [Suillus cothurnatus]|nr:peptidase family M49-domain-containing protein [Suillus cothurnatus]
MYNSIRFKTGSIEEHKAVSKYWVKDVGPVVKSYIGFVETYFDLYGARAEWEAPKYDILVDGAPELIKVLPWGEDFEFDVFRKSDFTALENVFPLVLMGKTISQTCDVVKNYYDIRESTGFKNVSLTVSIFAGVMCPTLASLLRHPSTKAPDEEITFIHTDDLDVYNEWDSCASELRVANHELLGHGSGKLFQEAAYC